MVRSGTANPRRPRVLALAIPLILLTLLPLAAHSSDTAPESEDPGETEAKQAQEESDRKTAEDEAAALPVTSNKTDRVFMLNGDYLTGEIKKLERGKLSFKTDATSTISIDWEDVSTLTSTSYFEIESSDGTKYFGSIPPSSGRGKLVVSVGQAAVELDLQEVVLITPIKKTFWARVDGSVTAGFSFTKSSDITQINLGSNAKYRAEKFVTDLRLDAIVTQKGEREEEDSQRADLTFTYTRFRKKRYFTEWSGAAQRNDELGLELRLLAGWAMGRAMVRTNHALLTTMTGLAVNQEWRGGDEPSDVNLELPLGANYDLFFFTTPKTDLKTGLTLYVGITDWGRNRLEQNLSFRREFIKDLFWELSTYVSFDSRPPNSAASSVDWGIVSSLGYSF